MPQLVAMIQTTWPKIRVGLYRHDDGLFQYIEEGLRPDNEGGESWVHFEESDLYNDIETAKADMIQFYAYQVEDEYWVEPESVVILQAPDFKGEHHPVLRLDRPE